MSWIRSMFNNFQNAVVGKVVEKRVANAIDNIDDDGIVALVDIFGESMRTTSLRVAIALTKVIKDNSLDIAELAGRNADTVIAFHKAIERLSNDINCDANKELVKKIVKRGAEIIKDQMDKADKEISEAYSSDATDRIIKDVAKSFGVDMDKTRYFIYKHDENGESTGAFEEVSKSRYMLRQVANKKERYNGSYYSTKVGNKIYESTPESFHKKH